MPQAGPPLRLTYEEATAKLLIMSWNPGSGVWALTQITDDSGYHICILQKSWPSTAEALPAVRRSFAHAAGQTILARAPAAVELIAKDESAACAGASPLCGSPKAAAGADSRLSAS